MSRPVAAEDLPGLGPRKGVPRLSPSIDWSLLQLDDVKGFVLSRVDGRTTLGEIVLLSPFPERQTVAILVELFGRGVIDIAGVPRPAPPETPAPRAPAAIPAPAPAPPAPPPATPTPARGVSPSLPPPPNQVETPPARPVARAALVPPPPSSSPPPMQPPSPPRAPIVPAPPPEAGRVSVVSSPLPSELAAVKDDDGEVPIRRPLIPDGPKPPIGPEIRARIDEMAALVAEDPEVRNPHHILGLPVGASRKDVQRAYFRLSKEFHPDRYFQRDLGEHKPRLLRIFNALTRAYEQLAHVPRPGAPK